jgi:hypothetical protein
MLHFSKAETDKGIGSGVKGVVQLDSTMNPRSNMGRAHRLGAASSPAGPLFHRARSHPGRDAFHRVRRIACSRLIPPDAITDAVEGVPTPPMAVPIRVHWCSFVVPHSQFAVRHSPFA